MTAAIPSAPADLHVVQRDDGLFQIGWHDARPVDSRAAHSRKRSQAITGRNASTAPHYPWREDQ